MKNRPSSHLLFLLALIVVSLVAYLGIYRSGVVRGYAPSLLVAARDLALYLPVGACLVWLVKRRRFAGDLTLFSAAILLFSIGQVIQFRLFTDPEYSAQQKSSARLSKTNTLRQRYINQYYDAEKKRALFGDPNFQIPLDSGRTDEANYWTVGRVATSISTWLPIFALLGFGIAFSLASRDDVLLLLQRYSFLLGVLTAIPFALIAIYYSSGGKFLGRTTPWEPVKLSFLVSYAGVLADQYRNLSRTRWGLPRLRFLLPFLFIALLPLVPFFALSDFGQMLVFSGAFLTLYVVAVRRLPQIAIAGLSVALLLVAAIVVTGLVKSFTVKSETNASFVEKLKDVPSRGVPRRLHQRFYLWLNAGVPPDPETTWWWERDAELADARGLSNEEAWYNSYAFQPSQALFGIADGHFLGEGLGRGFPEIVPIADSDFIYAALAEETGLVGGALVVLTFIVLIGAGLRTAIEASDMFTKLIAAGITAFIGLQAIVNIGGVVRMLPMTGITLPFVSHGGWSLMTSFAMLGVLMAISHRSRSLMGNLVGKRAENQA
ncbi:MAG: FtsW/RodA/SpoVE family cell cycle protein [Acidobacteriota bacterium]